MGYAFHEWQKPESGRRGQRRRRWKKKKNTAAPSRGESDRIKKAEGIRRRHLRGTRWLQKKEQTAKKKVNKRVSDSVVVNVSDFSLKSLLARV